MTTSVPVKLRETLQAHERMRTRGHGRPKEWLVEPPPNLIQMKYISSNRRAYRESTRWKIKET